MARPPPEAVRHASTLSLPPHLPQANTSSAKLLRSNPAQVSCGVRSWVGSCLVAAKGGSLASSGFGSAPATTLTAHPREAVCQHTALQVLGEIPLYIPGQSAQSGGFDSRRLHTETPGNLNGRPAGSFRHVPRGGAQALSAAARSFAVISTARACPSSASVM